MEKRSEMKEYAALYRNELYEEVIPFWEKYSLDKECNGYFTCITDQGVVFDTDKFVWLQARQAWMFATLANAHTKTNEWRETAKIGIDFLEKYGRSPEGDWYFSLTKEGAPLVAPYNIFSDCFAAMAFGAYFKIDPNPKYAQIAMDTFERILKRKDAPKGAYEKGISGTRPMQNFALPMILCNLALELEHLIGAQRVSELTKGLIPLILEQFYDKESGLILENIGPNGAQIDSFEGRLLNPGHAIEAMWFIMNLGIRSHDKAVIDKAEAIMYHHLEQGWDHEHGGIFYFLDRKGHPTQQLEWDQKLWWVHLETLVALAKTYAYNKSPKAKKWFIKVHDYSWNHFRDPINKGEWYGYLNREGNVLLPLKGGKWKGCFHVPRALYEISNTLALIDE
jgi:N-acylglucosamine 2-epimerase